METSRASTSPIALSLVIERGPSGRHRVTSGGEIVAEARTAVDALQLAVAAVAVHFGETGPEPTYGTREHPVTATVVARCLPYAVEPGTCFELGSGIVRTLKAPTPRLIGAFVGATTGRRSPSDTDAALLVTEGPPVDPLDVDVVVARAVLLGWSSLAMSQALPKASA